MQNFLIGLYPIFFDYVCVGPKWHFNMYLGKIFICSCIVKMPLEANTNTIKENGTEFNQENQEILHKIKFFQPFKYYTQPKKSQNLRHKLRNQGIKNDETHLSEDLKLIELEFLLGFLRENRFWVERGLREAKGLYLKNYHSLPFKN